MQLLRLARLEVVPDEHQVGHVADEALVRQVVPAEDREPGADAEPLCGAQPVGLARAEVDQRRDEHEVRLLLAQVARARPRAAASERSTGARSPTARRRAAEARRRRRLLRPRAELGRVPVARLEVAQVVEPSRSSRASFDRAARKGASCTRSACTRPPAPGARAAEWPDLTRRAASVDRVPPLVQQPQRGHQRPDARSARGRRGSSSRRCGQPRSYAVAGELGDPPRVSSSSESRYAVARSGRTPSPSTALARVRADRHAR